MLNIREIMSEEFPLLEDFLYNAIFLPPGVPPPRREIIFKPEIHIYIESFGKQDDCCVVSELDSKVVGAAWTRIIPAFGHIDDDTPELAVSVLPNYRGQGIGTKLLVRLFELLRERGYQATSLSVQKENPAFRLYRRLGYEIFSENTADYIMLKKL
jgi:ribosomal protein S18 acetylase RimI-like enzyme